MYRRGHYGVALLVFAPVGFVLTAAGALVPAAVLGGAMLWLAMLPDVDRRLPGVSHRGATHTLAFAAAVGLAVGAVGLALGPTAVSVVDAGSIPGVGSIPGGGTAALAVFGCLVGFASVLAHLVGDLLTPAGVALLWPLSGRRYSLDLVGAGNTLANYGLLTLGILVASGAVWLGLSA